MSGKNGKKPYEMAIKKSVSMPQVLFDRGELRQRELGLSTFSDYIQALMRSDLQRAGERRQQPELVLFDERR